MSEVNAPTNGATAPTNGAQSQPSEEEIDAIAGAARDLIPVMRFVGRPLSHGWENGVWYWKPDRDHEEKVGATEAFFFDLRSSGEVWKRWGLLDNGKRGVIDQIGGRYVDGWRNPPRHAMPEADEDFDDDPWKENSWIVLKRLSDGQADLERNIRRPGKHGRIPRHCRQAVAGAHRMHAGRFARVRTRRKEL